MLFYVTAIMALSVTVAPSVEFLEQRSLVEGATLLTWVYIPAAAKGEGEKSFSLAICGTRHGKESEVETSLTAFSV